MTRTIRFEEYQQLATKNLPCPTCGKKVRRQTTLTMTQSPYNKNPDGTVRSPQQIRAALIEQAREWSAQAVVCTPCSETSGSAA